MNTNLNTCSNQLKPASVTSTAKQQRQNKDKPDFTASLVRNAEQPLQTHVHLPAGGLVGLFQRNKEKGIKMFQEWNSLQPDWQKAQQICDIANENAELREMGFE